jgi:hypothetical protein
VEGKVLKCHKVKVKPTPVQAVKAQKGIEI